MFKNPFSFDGRIRRTEYGLTLIIYVVLATIINLIIEESRGDAGILGLAYIPMLWVLWAQGAKRCHDVGNNGWWQLIPFYGFWLIFQDGQPGSNQYGENPKGIQIIAGQPYQGGTNNPTQGNSNPQINTGSGYQGGYSGGHNNPTTNYNQTGQESQRDGYKDGDLYN
jgi:uncharacterized membrane protein YhaH (DUF805 family)